MTLLVEVAAELESRGIRFAVIGAAAMAAYGVPRSTMDVDLLLVGRESFDFAVWEDLQNSGITVHKQRGELDDPLDGVIRLSRENDMPVDIVIGSDRWQRRAVERANVAEFFGSKMPVATDVDLVLLKLYAGAPQDRWDITRLLAASTDTALQRRISTDVADLPKECGALWQSILETR